MALIEKAPLGLVWLSNFLAINWPFTQCGKRAQKHDIPTRRDVTMPTLGLMMKDPTRMVTMKIPRRHRTDVPTQNLDLAEELGAYSQPGSPRKTS